MITILQDSLYRAAYDVTSPKNPKTGKRAMRESLNGSLTPALACILLKSEEGELHLYTVSDGEAIVHHIPARIESDFATCVPFRAFLAWVELAGDTIELSLDSQTQILTAKTGKSRAEFKCIDPAEFPDVSGAKAAELINPVFVTTALAVSKDKTRPYLMGVYQIGNEWIATDGNRMHTAPAEYPIEAAPKKLADVYPEIVNGIQPTYTTTLTGADLLKAAKSLTPIAKQGSGTIRFSCNGSVKMSAKSEAMGESTVEIGASQSDPTTAEFALPYKQVIDAITHLDPKQPKPGRREKKPAPHPVTLKFSKPGAPIAFEAEGRRAIIMPC